jgi:plasmanylethanolamine desaturase
MRERPITPMFRDCTWHTAVVCWASIGSTVTTALGAWLVAHAELMREPAYVAPCLILISFYLADIISGVVHWTFDTWFDDSSRFPRAVKIAREHHSHPSHILGYGFRDYAGFSSFPAIVTLGPVAAALVLLPGTSTTRFHIVLVLLVILVCMLFASHAHAMAHRRARSQVVRRLQRAHLLLSPEHHRGHHSGGHDTRYCALFGWANGLCDSMGLWRRLERLVQAITGAEPRAYDREWMAMHRRVTARS